MNPIERRLQKIEAVVMPKPHEEIVGLIEPKDDASADDLTAYAVELAAAKASGAKIVVVREGAIYGRRQQDPDGIEYVRTEAEALMFWCGAMPSKRGNANLLADVLRDCSGRGLEPVRLPAGQ